jgi:ferric-dicitrate binding protein FerR (iron transport regulator)
MLTIPAIKDITYDLRDSMVLETSWLYNTLAFRDESFLELANKMEKWYGIEITFESKRLENIRFTGRFTTETIQEALEALQFTADFQFKKDQNSITIY